MRKGEATFELRKGVVEKTTYSYNFSQFKTTSKDSETKHSILSNEPYLGMGQSSYFEYSPRSNYQLMNTLCRGCVTMKSVEKRNTHHDERVKRSQRHKPVMTGMIQ